MSLSLFFTDTRRSPRTGAAGVAWRETGARVMDISAGALAKKYHLCCLQENREIEQQRVVLYVVEVVLQLLERILLRRPVWIAELRPSGDAGLYAVALHVIRNALGELGDELRALRSGPHQAHLPPQHIEELRQLIQAYLPDQRPDASHAWVALLRPPRSAVDLRVGAHAAKLEHIERPASEAHSALPIEHRRLPSILGLDRESRQQHERQRQRQSYEASCQVQRPGADEPQRITPEPLPEDHPAGVEDIEPHATGLALQESEQLRDVEARQAAFQKIGDRKPAAPVIHGD